MVKKNNLRIIIDGIVFENTYQIGIWRVFYEILSRISDCADVTLWLRAPAVQPLPKGVRLIEDRGRQRISRRNIPLRLVRKLLPRHPAVDSLRVPEGTIFHSTYFTPCPNARMIQVTSLYDMIAETHYSISGNWAVNDALKKRQELFRSKRIIAISKSAASDLICFYPELKDRVDIVHLGADHLYKPYANTRTTCTAQDFVLYVGSRDSYKNFVTLLDAMLSPAWPDGVLLHVVGAPLADHELRLIDAKGLTHRVVGLGKLPDDELRMQYSSATCFVFPSLAEGFGLPVLEAQINSCPVACSDIPVFHEVAGDSAVYFDPRLSESIADAIQQIYRNGIRDDLIRKGSSNSSKFSWDQAAVNTLDIYHAVANLRACAKN